MAKASKKPSDSHDFIVTVHALDRFQERFPEYAAFNDDLQAQVIYEEVMEAFEAGRASGVAPAELAPLNHHGWKPAAKGCSYVWNKDKERGYVLQRVGTDLLVLTVLTGPRDGEEPVTSEGAHTL